MDRLNATSRADSPDWPLPSVPPPSLTNVSRESRRHCRVFPTGMVNLSLVQMADTIDREQHNSHHPGDNYRQTESIEQDSESSAFNSRRMEKSKKRNTEKKREYVRPENLDDIMHAVDALQSQLDSPDSTTELPYPYYHAVSPPLNSPASTIENSYPYYHALSPPLNSPSTTIEVSYLLTPSSTTSPPLPSSPTIPLAELDAHDTTIPPPSPPPKTNPLPTSTILPTPPAFPPINPTTPLNSHPPKPTDFIINPTTPLNSNPPTPSDRAFARTLHTALPKQAFEPYRPPPPRPLHATLATYDAMTSYRDSLAPLTAKRALASVINRGFGGVVAMAARVSQKRRAMREKKEEKTKTSFPDAVNKGFKDVFGERGERGW